MTNSYLKCSVILHKNPCAQETGIDRSQTSELHIIIDVKWYVASKVWVQWKKWDQDSLLHFLQANTSLLTPYIVMGPGAHPINGISIEFNQNL